MTATDNQAAMRGYQVGMSTHHLLHHHDHHSWSRRRFLQVGGLLVGAVAAGLPWGGGTALAAKPGSGIPSQLPDFSPVLQGVFGIEIPFFLPIETDPFAGGFDPVANPATIWDFNGSLGLIDAAGVSDPNNNSDGVARRWACDVRFMQGVFRDRAGRTQPGAVGFF
jgi:hypothetical protein